MSWAVLLLSFAPAVVSAQTDVEELGRRFGSTPPARYYEILRENPNAFQFSPDNGWIRRGRRVAAFRNRGRGRVSDEFLMTQAAHDVGGVMTGDVYVPVFLILFANTDSLDVATSVPRASLETRLYGTDPAPPYSVHTYYREVSNNLVNVYGTVFDWAFVAGDDSTYEGNDNGLAPPYMGPLMQDIATVWDDSVDFGQFDNDGPDGVPNSGDDDGFVDAVVLIHPKVDGSCMAVNSEAETAIWAHRFFAGPYATNDVSTSGGSVMLRDYIVQGGQGGDEGCTSDEPQAMGVVAHETGHLFGLDDLYDTIGDGAGIGRWGLMGSGNQLTPVRPTHLNAYSKAQLGWITEVLIDNDTSFAISPVVTSDTAYVLPIRDTDEYFLLENRQHLGSDANLYEEGLLIWHVDSLLARLRGNNVNGYPPYAVALEQADGRDDLLEGSNRGDRGDPFPGFLNNRSFGLNTTPSSSSNDGSLSFVAVDSITPVGTTGAINVKIGFGVPALVVVDESLPNATMGTEFRHQLTASGGIGGESWGLASGQLPDGMSFSITGLLAGIPEETGEYLLGITVSSGTQTVVDTLEFAVVAPTLVTEELLEQLVGQGTPLSPEDLYYLDLLGNRNSWFDVGDFLAWVEATRPGMSAGLAAVLERVSELGGGASDVLGNGVKAGRP